MTPPTNIGGPVALEVSMSTISPTAPITVNQKEGNTKSKNTPSYPSYKKRNKSIGAAKYEYCRQLYHLLGKVLNNAIHSPTKVRRRLWPNQGSWASDSTAFETNTGYSLRTILICFLKTEIREVHDGLGAGNRGYRTSSYGMGVTGDACSIYIRRTIPILEIQ